MFTIAYNNKKTTFIQLNCRICVIFLSLIFINCTTIHDEYGIQEQAIAFIPARIAVLPCQPWPRGLSYKGLPLSNTGDEKAKELCSKIDDFVVEGFSGQPYMRGISPSIVTKLLKQSENMDLLTSMNKILLSENGTKCSNCTSPIAYYKKAIAPQEDWRLWLNSFSRSVANADAILLPFLIFSYEGRANDRGLETAYRQAGILLFLIDTNSAKLIWSGGRQAEIKNQGKPYEVKTPDTPSWKALEERLFISDVWQEFPGRQNY